jgi:urease accessory protein
MDNFLSLLQFSDGLFPAGAYAHSFGLESCVQSGEVRSAEGVEEFLRGYLAGSAAPADLVALLCARRAGEAGDLASCYALDDLLDAVKLAAELREASRQMGRQTLRVANSLINNNLLSEFGNAAAKGFTPCHHPIVIGMIGTAFDWPCLDISNAYLYSTSAAIVGAALRLLPLGQLAGQRILWNLRPLISRLAAEAQNKNQDDLWSFTPALEIAGMQHATLDARLFRS